MATKSATPAKETKTKPAKDNTAKTTGAKPGRKPGTVVNENDLFVVCDDFDDAKKIAPQAKAIANLVKAAGKKGITRGALIEAMEGVVTTRQPQGRILSYYQKKLVDEGYFTVAKPDVPEAPPEEPAATEETPAKS